MVEHRHLKPACLPIPALPRLLESKSYYTHRSAECQAKSFGYRKDSSPYYERTKTTCIFALDAIFCIQFFIPYQELRGYYDKVVNRRALTPRFERGVISIMAKRMKSAAMCRNMKEIKQRGEENAALRYRPGYRRSVCRVGGSGVGREQSPAGDPRSGRADL